MNQLDEFLDWCNENEEWPLGAEPNASEPEGLTELIETGSVTVEVAGRKWEIALLVKEVPL